MHERLPKKEANLKIKQELQEILRNQRGIALMLIMTAIIVLMAIYGEFTFESKIGRMKATNVLDKAQAKLLAESGLQLAMTRLRLYQEAYNKIQGNENAKNLVQPQLLNQLWEVPFIYPIPVSQNATVALKDTIGKFTEESLLDGEMKVSIQNLSNKMNLNLLRVSMLQNIQNQGNNQDNSSSDYNEESIKNNVSIDQTLYFLLKTLVDEKREKNKAFDDRYGGLNYQELISNLKFYISDSQSLTQDPMAGEAEANFNRIPLTPKHGPLSSSSELYVIPKWNDELIELISNEFSVYPSSQIDFNKITANMLRILIPNITDDELRDFFVWRDDPEQPRFINNKEDFKKYIVGQARLMNETDFDNRMKQFEEKGFNFGANPTQFKIVSEGTYNRANYTLIAFVILPSTSSPASGQGSTNKCPEGQIGTPPECRPMTEEEKKAAAEGAEKTNSGGQLLEPRIIEIQIN